MVSFGDRSCDFKTHLIELLRGHSPSELLRGFDRPWMKWAGPPLRATTDLEGGFQCRDFFWKSVGESGCSLSSMLEPHIGNKEK